jgi:DNA-damage-inducible protein D
LTALTKDLFVIINPPSSITCQAIQKGETMNQTKAELVLVGDVRLVLFKGEEIRQVFHNNEWLFSIIDVINVLSGSSRPSKYWSDLKRQLVTEEGVTQLSSQIGQLKMPATDGKMRETDVVNINTVLRIVQSIQSKHAELFKRWLAEVGGERLQEINDPEMAIQRAIYNYRSKGHDDKWIQKRLQSVLNRRLLEELKSVTTVCLSSKRKKCEILLKYFLLFGLQVITGEVTAPFSYGTGWISR